MAAFECKLTLRQEHLREAFETSRLIADAMPSRWGSPYRELHRPMVYGLLAHSHEWNGARAQPEENIDSGLSAMLQALDHPRKMLDVLCVSDVGTWTATKAFTTGRHEIDERGSITWRSTNDPLAFAGYVRHHQSRVMTTSSPFTNVGAMVMDLWTRLGRERAELRPIADYFHSVPGLAGDGRGVVKSWRLGELLSQSVQDELARLDSQSPRIPQPAVCTEKNSGFWSDWHQAFTW